MKHVLITGASGFIGKNLMLALSRFTDIKIFIFTKENTVPELTSALQHVDVIYHLAGVNRPKDEEEFNAGNVCLTDTIVKILKEIGRSPMIVFPSSIQAILDNPYGKSKKKAENIILKYHDDTNAPVAIYRLPNVFGKWSRPNYNTVVATFCHNIARNQEIVISDSDRELELVYIDDVVDAFTSHLACDQPKHEIWYSVDQTFHIKISALADRIKQLHAIQSNYTIPDQADPLTKNLYATYLTFLPEQNLASPVKVFKDPRGWLFELIKSHHFGQIFVSKTRPGIKRGDHYHDSKIEKFCVIQGNARITLRNIYSTEVIEFFVDGEEFKIVEIPPGYTHAIENVGKNDMLCLFWANGIFSQQVPDTYPNKVQN